VDPGLRQRASLTRLRGSQIPMVAGSEGRGSLRLEESGFGLSGSGGFEDPRLGRVSEGDEIQESIDHWPGSPGGCERTRGGKQA